MNVSLNWLSNNLDLEGLSVSEISDMLTFAGIEVEGIEERGVSTDKVVVAQIVSAEQHPDAEKLKVTKVDVGDGSLHQIVCGAKNYKVGDKVPCALPGAVLPGNFEIKVGKLRGIESCGMLCSASELGMPDKVDGLMILDPSLPLGKPMRELVSSDVLIEVEITPNRPDLLSHWGMAVELAAITGRSLKPAPVNTLREMKEAGSSVILESDLCPYYTATRIKGVKVQESPEWLQEKLLSIGLHPINNVVDITNYVLHELGHPLHAFDAACVKGGIVVRQANEGEEILALDGQTYKLLADDILISDAEGQALAIGGVMGGESSSVTESTQDIILESAWFNSSSVRRTSRRLALSSDSSYRFERGTTIFGANKACALATKLLVEICGGEAETTVFSGELIQPSLVVPYDFALLDQMTGCAIPHDEARGILSRLGLTEKNEGWVIPPWRLDLTRSADLSEEVVRVFGLDKIPARMQSVFVEASSVDTAYDYQMSLRQRLVGAGFYETQTIKLIAEESLDGTIAQAKDALALKPMIPGDQIRVALPLSEDHAVLRPSLIPGLVSVAVRNSRQGAQSLRFFEMGKTFRNAGGGKAKDIEVEVLALFMAGTLNEKTWSRSSSAVIAAEDLLAVLSLLMPKASVTLVPSKRAGFAQSADIQVNKKPVGCFARMSLARCRELGLPLGCFVAELELKKLQDIALAPMKAQELPLYPGSSRDVAFELPLSLANAQVEKALESVKEPLLVEYGCFDVFTDPTGEKLAQDRKSVAYSMTYRSKDRTLKSEEVEAAHQNVLNHLVKSVKGLTLRF